MKDRDFQTWWQCEQMEWDKCLSWLMKTQSFWDKSFTLLRSLSTIFSTHVWNEMIYVRIIRFFQLNWLSDGGGKENIPPTLKGNINVVASKIASFVRGNSGWGDTLNLKWRLLNNIYWNRSRVIESALQQNQFRKPIDLWGFEGIYLSSIVDWLALFSLHRVSLVVCLIEVLLARRSIDSSGTWSIELSQFGSSYGLLCPWIRQ